MNRFIARNDLIIVPITETEYLAKFGATFEQAEEGLDTPHPYSSIDDLLDVALEFFGHDEIRDMISVQSSPYYRDAVLIRAIARGKFKMLNAEDKMHRALQLHQSSWTVNNETASAQHKHGLDVRFYQAIDGVAQFIDNDAVVLGVFRDGETKWIAVTTEESKAKTVNKWLQSEPVERELLEQYMFERDEQGSIKDRIISILGHEAVSEWAGRC
jgi:hypothetical protein